MERHETKKNVKGERQKDIFFVNSAKNYALYSEVKANINLDTQKTKATIQSIQEVVEKYRNQGMTIDAYLISLRYLQTSDIPPQFVKKYKDVQLIGIRDFIETVLHIEVPELQSYETYSSFLMRIANHVERE
jgi:chitinase